MYDTYMENLTLTATWVVYVPGVNTVRTYGTYAEAWRASEEVLASTGRVALVEPLRG